MSSPTDSRVSELAVNGGKPVRTEPYPPWPHYGPEEIAAAVKVLESGQLSSLSGPHVREFEQAWAEFQGVKHAVAISSGTGAIHAALIAAEIGPGDDVIVTPHSFIASVTAVLHAGARPVFADIDRRTFNLTAESIEAAITPNTRAVVTVHLNGHPADPEATAALCEERDLFLIEDCAQAHGARWNGRLVGTYGRIGTYSFWEDKILTTSGEGGMLVTDDDNLARRARMAIHHGEEPTDENYYAGERLYLHQLIGWNYRMTEVQGAIGKVQLSRLDGYLARRRELAAIFSEALSGVPGIVPPFVDERATHSFYKYIVQLDRDVLSVPVFDFVEALRAEGVPATRRYPTSIHEQPIIVEKRGFGRSTFPFGDDYPKPPAMPNAERVARDAIQVTVVNPSVSDQDVRDAAAAIEKLARAFAESGS